MYGFMLWSGNRLLLLVMLVLSGLTVGHISQGNLTGQLAWLPPASALAALLAIVTAFMVDTGSFNRKLINQYGDVVTRRAAFYSTIITILLTVAVCTVYLTVSGGSLTWLVLTVVSLLPAAVLIRNYRQDKQAIKDGRVTEARF